VRLSIECAAFLLDEALELFEQCAVAIRNGIDERRENR
jgi:hypothetical protein